MHVISGRLNEDAKQFPSANGTNFSVRLGRKIKAWNKDTKQEEETWTNYSASFYCANDKTSMNDFLSSVLVAGSFIVVNGDDLHAKTYQKQDGSIGVELAVIRPSLGGFNKPESGDASSPSPAQAQNPPASPAVVTPADADFDDDIPF